MEGGSMRGMFTAGVIDVFLENKIEFDGAIGVSAGATFGCNIKSKQIGRALRYNCKYCNHEKYGSFKSLIKTGDFFDEDFCYHKIPEELDPFDETEYEKNPMEFYAVATDVVNGKPVYHKCITGLNNDLEWIRASASIPMLSKVVGVEGYKLLDGGISDSIPLKYFEKIGYDKNVVILTQPDNFIKQKNKLTWLCRLIYWKYPKFVDIFANRHIMYNDTTTYIKERESRNEIFVIRPKEKLDIKSAEKNVDKLKAVYQLGREAALEAISERNLKEFLL